MKQKAYILLIHGKGGSPDSSWFPWMKKNLEKKDFNCIVPLFPPEKNATLADWLRVLHSLQLELQHTTIVAHARGAMAVLRWVESLPAKTKIKHIITVSCNFDYQPQRNDETGFYTTKLNYENLKKKCQKFVVIHSEDDRYVPILAGEQLAKALDAKFVRLKNAGHFGSEKTEAPEILREILT